MHGLTLQEMDSAHRGAPPFQERRHQQGGGEWTQLSGDHIHLQREVAAQGGIAAADQPPALEPRCRQGRRQGPADLTHPLGRRRRRQRPGVGKQKQQGRWVLQPRRQGGPIPAQQQGTAVHGLGAGWVIVKNDDLEVGGHGTIVP